MRPVISILTPTFNHEKYIQTCIESVVNQTYPHWEMIIVDDGSTDETPKIVGRYKDSRIIYLRKEHRGINYLGENYNHAMRISRGDLLLILEGDDFLPPHRFELQLRVFEDEKVVLSHGRYGYVFNNKTVVYPTPFKMEDLRNRPVGSALKIFLQGFNPIGSQSVMIRKSALQEIGGFTQPKYLPLVDYPTWMKLALKGTFEFIPEILGFWRRHPQSVTMNRNEQIFEGFIQYCDEFVATFHEELVKLGLIEFSSHRGAIAYLSLCWIKLSQGDWIRALELGRKGWALRRGVSWSFKRKMLIGLMGAYLNIDLPKYFKRMNQWLHQEQAVKGE
jgi:glycosyltransferase involved in cell wall biosynthesis